MANYWHCLPTYEQARKAVWEAVNPHTGKRRIDEAFPKELRSRTDNSAMTIEFKVGSVWRIVGSDNPDSLVGAPPAGIVFSEWALANPSAWGYLAPILEENGGWADFITTPRGRNHVKGMLDMARRSPNWFAEVLTVDDTKLISMDAVEEQRREYHSIYGADAGDALIQQEYWCSFEAAILGAYYGREMVQVDAEGRIGEVPIWPDIPVHTAWDLGVSRGSDTMTIWLYQIAPSETGKAQIRVVGYISGSGYAIPHYQEQIRKVVDNAGHRRGTDWVPHDAKVPEMTSSGKDGRAKQRIEVMIECGMKPRLVPNHHVADGISAVRQIIGRCHFDELGCATGIECLRQYQHEWDDDLKVFKPTPRADWAAHGADAFRYLAMGVREANPVEAKEPGRMLTIGQEGIAALPPGVKPVTLNDLWDARRRESKRF